MPVSSEVYRGGAGMKPCPSIRATLVPELELGSEMVRRRHCWFGMGGLSLPLLRGRQRDAGVHAHTCAGCS